MRVISLKHARPLFNAYVHDFFRGFHSLVTLQAADMLYVSDFFETCVFNLYCSICICMISFVAHSLVTLQAADMLVEAAEVQSRATEIHAQAIDMQAQVRHVSYKMVGAHVRLCCCLVLDLFVCV